MNAMKRNPHSKKTIYSFFLLFVLFIFSTYFLKTDYNPSYIETFKNISSSNIKIFNTFGKIPLYFEQNNGQVAENIKFLSRGSDYTLMLKQDEAILSFKNRKKDKSKSNIIRMKYVNHHDNTIISGLEKQRAKSNYFIGNNPDDWQKNIPNYLKVKYENIYDGIDLVYYGNQGCLEFDYIIAPGIDPDIIQFAVEGADNISLDSESRLHLSYDDNEVVIGKPHIYQMNGSKQTKIDGHYHLSDNIVSFEVADYNPQLALVIDPKIIFSTFIGNAEARAIDIDKYGNTYLTGRTDDKSFPISDGAFQTELKELRSYQSDYDVYITKLNADGSDLLYSTYIGGGECNEEVFDIAVDANGCVHITGGTFSDDFPVTEGAFKTDFNDPGDGGSVGWTNLDAYILKLDSSGSSLVYSTFLGGEWEDYGFGIDLDHDGYAYVTGFTVSEHFPTTNGAYQEQGAQFDKNAFVTKMELDGSAPVYSTFLRNPQYSEEFATDIAVDKEGNAYITGRGILTGDANDGETPDIFVAKLNSTGSSLIFSKQVADGSSYGIAVDSEGNSYITGTTNSPYYWNNLPFPITDNAFKQTASDHSDAFLTKLDPSGSTILYSTLIGGNGDDIGYDITVDNSGNVYIAGVTRSDDLLVKDAVQEELKGNNDAFVVKIDPLKSGDASLVYATYLGGSSYENLFSSFIYGDVAQTIYDYGEFISRGAAIAVDSKNNAYIFGSTYSTDYPATDEAYSTIIPVQNNSNIFVTKIGHDEVIENLVYDQVINGGPPVFSTAPSTPQQTLPQYYLNSQEDTLTFRFQGKSTDGKVALRIFNTAIVNGNPLPLDLSGSVTIHDPDDEEILGSTLLNIASMNFGKQFNVSKDGTYTIKVAAASNSTFPAPFQIHLAGNVGLPSPRDNTRGTRVDILFNHTAPRPQGIYGSNDGVAQTALFKFANPAELSPFAVAVMVPPLNSGFPNSSAILRAPDPVQPLSITTPTARTPLCGGGDATGKVIDFTQVPDPAIITANLDGSLCAVIGENDGTSYTASSSLIFDMGSGQEIVNGDGDDFQVLSSAGNYDVAVSNTPYTGTFIPIGETVSGTQSFDLSNTDLTSARFVLITPSPGATLDAIKALNVFSDAVVTDPITGSEILTGDVATATMTMRRAKAPELEFDPFLELIAPDGSRFGDNESGFADKTSQDLSDAALIDIDLVQPGFYRFLGRGYHQNPGDQSSGAFFVRLESGGTYDPQDIIVSDKDENNTAPQKTGTIIQTRQRDSYLFQYHPGQAVNIVVNARDAKLNPIVELYDPEDFLIAASDNAEGRDKNSVLQVNLPAASFNSGEALPDPSTYRVVVSAVDSAGAVLSEGDITVFQRTVSGGTYDLKVFTGDLTWIGVSRDDKSETAASVIKNFNLLQNYPNPFNSTTTITYELPKSEKVILKIFNSFGQETGILVNSYQSAGQHKITWQPDDLSTGIYFCSLQAGEYSQKMKLILLK